MLILKCWTKVDDAALAGFYAQGKDDEFIGRSMGRSQNAVRERRSLLGLVKYKKQPYTQTKKREPGTKRRGRTPPPGTPLQLF